MSGNLAAMMQVDEAKQSSSGLQFQLHPVRASAADRGLNERCASDCLTA